MSLYNYVVYVVTKLFGFMTGFNASSQRLTVFPLYPSSDLYPFEHTWTEGFINSNGGFLFSRWRQIMADVSESVDVNPWWRFFSDPRLIVSTFIWFVCIFITIEICLILPFRAFKRLVRYPNRNLMTPGEYRRSKRR